MNTIQTERSTGGTIEVVGTIWQPGMGVCAMTYNLRPYDVSNMRGQAFVPGIINRADVQDWLDTNAGDFQNVIDFHAVIDDGPLPSCASCGHAKRRKLAFDWADEDNESEFLAATFG